MVIKIALFMMISYFFGCFNTGYYYARLFYKRDIREIGTSVTGAMNVSRLAGRKGFVLTFLGDAVKGALVVLLARGIDMKEWAVLLSIFLVLLGHIFPVQLRFHGGKGMSTIFGAFLVYQPWFVLYLFLTCIVFYVFVRRYTITSLYAFLIFPLELFLIGYSLTVVLFAAASSALIIFACRSNIKEYVKERAYHS